MQQMENLFSEMWDWLSSPFKKDMSASQLALIIIVYVIIAFILYDSVKILGQWMAQAAEGTGV